MINKVNKLHVAFTDPSAEGNFRWFNTGLINTPISQGEYPVEFLYREVLSTESIRHALGITIPDWHDGLERYFDQLQKEKLQS